MIMQNDIIYALDFDGVICDSAVETGVTGWKGATRIWDDINRSWPSDEYIDLFRKIRPIVETGYEAILAMRLLFEDYRTDDILVGFAQHKQRLLLKKKLDSEELKSLFGEIRDQWINENMPEWVEMNPLFEGVAKKLQTLSTTNTWYIVTTKQERFVSYILEANHIQLPDSHIFGLDRNLGKEAVLRGLQQQHSGQEIHFVEDRLATLVRFLNSPELRDIKLFFAEWGYNTREDKAEAGRLPVTTLELNDFLIG
jgi:phosphoglycolate phosphatase-like HAD superfamily hydrolase